MSNIGMLCLLLAVLSGCNTITGVGRDITSVGNWMHDTASDIRGEPVNPNNHTPAPDYTSNGSR